ncbi:hypothetical protein DB313_04600 (plasmid) [Borrelia turcica IST7]|uniref:Uncharacterized protein n=1 Tax=Borrelia turcica IST7 TaxID=1104446 RepID=A0A386PMG5_9SPIR|nr:DUF685 domain-containing protein [Borrelia turcica]AYE36781.1 hypothetical protein DB313_04600 [Borrelia turcica IST7]
MSHDNSSIEDSVQIKDFNRKIKVNENDLIPIDDIVEETYAITYKNLLEQIKKDTFYEGLDYFKKVIREIISRELLEDNSYTEKMYLKIISKLMGLKTEPSSIDFNILFNKIKETLIERLTHSGYDAKLGKISIYNPNRKDFELIEFKSFINNLKEIFAENKDIEQLRQNTNNNFVQKSTFNQTRSSFMDTFLHKKDLSKEINHLFKTTQHTYNKDNLELIVFNKTQNLTYKLEFPTHLQGVPENFQYWGIKTSSDSFYFYHEFKTKTLKIEIINQSVELRFPQSLTGKTIYLRVILNLSKNPNRNEGMTKEVNARFIENTNASQYSSIFFYSGSKHNLTLTLLEGWYLVKSSMYNDDPNQSIPHLMKI